MLKLKDYCCETAERTDNKKGGGVGIAIHKQLHFVRRHDLEQMFPSFELCIVDARSHRKNILVSSLYRAPNTNGKLFLEEYKKLVEKLKSEPK